MRGYIAVLERRVGGGGWGRGSSHGRPENSRKKVSVYRRWVTGPHIAITVGGGGDGWATKGSKPVEM